jgi:inosine/xanthosine triphosphate pyrophosphatase family protein
MDKTFGEISPKNKDDISHRTRAFVKLKDYFTAIK